MCGGYAGNSNLFGQGRSRFFGFDGNNLSTVINPSKKRLGCQNFRVKHRECLGFLTLKDLL